MDVVEIGSRGMRRLAFSSDGTLRADGHSEAGALFDGSFHLRAYFSSLFFPFPETECAPLGTKPNPHCGPQRGKAARARLGQRPCAPAQGVCKQVYVCIGTDAHIHGVIAGGEDTFPDSKYLTPHAWGMGCRGSLEYLDRPPARRRHMFRAHPLSRHESNARAQRRGTAGKST